MLQRTGQALPRREQQESLLAAGFVGLREHPEVVGRQRDGGSFSEMHRGRAVDLAEEDAALASAALAALLEHDGAAVGRNQVHPGHVEPRDVAFQRFARGRDRDSPAEGVVREQDAAVREDVGEIEAAGFLADEPLLARGSHRVERDLSRRPLSREPDLAVVGPPGQTAHVLPAPGNAGFLRGRPHDVDRVEPVVVLLDEGAIASAGKAHVANLAGRLVDHPSDGVLDPGFALHVADDGERGAVGGPVGQPGVLEDGAGRAAGQRHAREGPGPFAGLAASDGDGHLPERGDREQVPVGKPEVDRLAARGPARDAVGRSVLRSGIDDRAPVGSEAGREGASEAERHALVGRRVAPRQQAGEQEPGGEPRSHEAGARQRLLPVARGRVEAGGRCRRRHARERLEVEGEVVGRVKARLGILLEAVVDDALEAGVDLAVRRRELGRLPHEDRRHGRGRGVAVEGALPREHLVQDGAEREDVGTRVGRAAAHLLGGHVAERSEDHAGLGGGRGARLGPDQLGQAEVEDLQAAVFRDEDVLGLQVPVNDALLVGGGEAPGGLERELRRPARGKGAGREAAAERLAFEQLRNDVGRSLVRPDVEDRRDVRMVQKAGGFGLLLETPQAIGVARKALGKDLERDVAAQPRVPRAVDVTHPPGAEPREDFVGPEPSLRREWHRWVRRNSMRTLGPAWGDFRAPRASRSLPRRTRRPP